MGKTTVAHPPHRGALSVLCSGAVALMAGQAMGQATQNNQERGLEQAVRQAQEGAIPDYRLKVDTNLDITERSSIDVGGSTSFFFLNLNDANDNHRRLLQPDVTLYGKASIDGVHNFFVRANFEYRDFSQGDSFNGGGDTWATPMVDRYVYEFDYARAVAAYDGRRSDWDFKISGGRQFVDWGEGIVLSEALYAVRPTLTFGHWQIEGLAGVTPADQSITDWDASRSGYNNNTQRGYFGGLVRYTFQNATQVFVYGIDQQDFNTGTQYAENAPVALDFRYQSWYVGTGVEGSIGSHFTYLGEFSYESGKSMSDPLRGVQQSEQISAYAIRAQGTFLLLDAWNTKFECELLLASGDGDRSLSSTNTVGGNQAGTQDTAFNSLGFVNTGLAFSPALSNIWTTRLGVSAFPLRSQQGFEQFQVGLDLLIDNKFDTAGPIEESTYNDRYLGAEIDLSINYRITSDFALTTRYGVFFPGEAIAGPKAARQFIFTGFTLSF